MVKYYEETKADYAPLKASRKFQDSKLRKLHRTHEILESEQLTDDEKFICLITEQGFGRQRAQELVYGTVRYKAQKREAKEVEFDKYTLQEVDI